jgi:hypothetical protein
LKGGLNTYLYAQADPVQQVDPTGENPASAAWWTGTRIGGLINYGVGMATGSTLGILLYDACNEDEEECIEEIEACMLTCIRARNDPNQRGVWGGSWWKCLTGCVPFRCQDYLDEGAHGDPGK